MNKLNELEEIDFQDKKNVDAWYEEMKRQFEEDSKTHDFSISKEWDEDFRKAMFGTVEKKGRDRRARRKVLYAAAGIALLVIAGVGVSQNEVIGDSLNKIFKNKSDAVDSEVDHFGTKEEMITGKNEEDERVSFEDKTLTEVYEQVRTALKRPIFQMKDDLGRYEIQNVICDTEFNVVIIQLETENGKIYVSQREILDNSNTGVKREEESVIVWNENLQQNIIVNKSVQDASCTFSVIVDHIFFTFYGYISQEICCKIAQEISFY